MAPFLFYRELFFEHRCISEAAIYITRNGLVFCRTHCWRPCSFYGSPTPRSPVRRHCLRCPYFCPCCFVCFSCVYCHFRLPLLLCCSLQTKSKCDC